jgi:hypothetical protein
LNSIASKPTMNLGNGKIHVTKTRHGFEIWIDRKDPGRDGPQLHWLELITSDELRSLGEHCIAAAEATD